MQQLLLPFHLPFTQTGCSRRWEIGQTAPVGLKSLKQAAFHLLIRLNQIFSLTWLPSRALGEENHCSTIGSSLAPGPNPWVGSEGRKGQDIACVPPADGHMSLGRGTNHPGRATELQGPGLALGDLGTAMQGGDPPAQGCGTSVSSSLKWEVKE